MYDQEKSIIQDEGCSGTTLSSPATGFECDVAISPRAIESKVNEDFNIDIEQQNRDFPLRNPHISGMRYLLFNVYRRLFSLVVIANAIAFVLVMLTHRTVLSFINGAAVNLLLCGLARQPLVVNMLFKLVCMIPRSAPYRLRTLASNVFHYGGVHSGAGVASFVWYLAFIGLLTCETRRNRAAEATATLVLAYLNTTFLAGMIVAALPAIRRKYHDYFELTHRFSGWLLVVLFWALFILFGSQQTQSLGVFLIHQPSFWVLVLITVAIIHPWLSLAKVKVEAEPLSNHAIRLHFDYTTPKFGQGISIARHPLKDFHSFAGFPDRFDTSNSKFSVVVSSAGDWTKDIIRRPPTRIWKRAIPTYGYGTVMKVFTKIVVVASGSGIGPCLSFLGDDDRPRIRVVWFTRSPEETCGSRLLGLVRCLDPDPIIWNSDRQGRLDNKMPLILKTYQDFQAEAVCVISNPSMTGEIVFGLQQRGVRASGPIFDS